MDNNEINNDSSIDQTQNSFSFSAVDSNESEIVTVPEIASAQSDEQEEQGQGQESEDYENDYEGEEGEEDEDEYIELDEQTAWEFLKGKKGLTIDNIDEFLTPKEQKKYAPEMEKFNEFIEKTGNKNYNDFLETQKDWGAESAENRLKNYIKLSNPDLTEKEANHLYNKKYNTNDLDEDIDEDEILEKGINVKADLRKADAFFEQRKQEFNAVRGSDEYIPAEYREAKKFYDDHNNQEEEFNNEREAKRNSFIAKTEALFNRDFEGFKIKLGDENTGFEEFSIKPENLNEIKEQQLDSNNFIKKFLDAKTGEINDHKGYHEAIYMANNYKEELNNAYNRGMAKQLELNDKLSKNIQPDNIRQAPANSGSGITYTREQ